MSFRSLFPFFLMFMMSISAKPIKLDVINLEIIEHSEHFGDEVFLHILESHGDKVREHFLPKYPFYFRQGHLDNFKRTTLWQKEVDSEEIVLYISMIEKDAAPWNIDDLVGQMTLTLRQENDEIVSVWDVVDSENLDKVISYTDNAIDIELFNDNGRYRLNLVLEEV